MSWTQPEKADFVRALHDYWPGKQFMPRLDDEYLEALDRFPLRVAMDALKRCKHEEEFSRRPTIRLVQAKAHEIANATGHRCGSPKGALIAKLTQDHMGKIWRGEKARVKITSSGFHLVDKKPGDWLLPWGDCTEGDLQRVVTELERGVEEAPF